MHQPVQHGIEQQSTRRFNLLKVVFTILFITLPFVGFWVGMEYQKTAKIEPVCERCGEGLIPTPTTIIQSNPSAEMEYWKTYRNTQYNYSLKYPPNWNIGYYPTNTTPETTDLIVFDKFKNDSSYIPGQVSIGVIASTNPNHQTLKDLIINEDVSLDYPLAVDFNSPIAALNYRKKRAQEMQSTTFNGFEALKDGDKRLFINAKDRVFSIFIFANDELTTEDKQIFNQILSSFLFN